MKLKLLPVVVARMGQGGVGVGIGLRGSAISRNIADYDNQWIVQNVH